MNLLSVFTQSLWSLELTPPMDGDGNALKEVTIFHYLTGYETFSQYHPWTEDRINGKMITILRRPILKMDKLKILLTHKSAIYSKPPKEKIGAVVGLNTFSVFFLNKVEKRQYQSKCASIV